MGHREPAPGAAEGSDDFIRDQQDVIPRAHLAHPRPIIVCRIDDSAGAVDRLSDECGDTLRPLSQDGFLEFARGCLSHRFSGLCAFVSVRIAGLDVNETRYTRLEHLPVAPHLGSAHGLQRDPMVAFLAGNHLHLAGLAARLPEKARGLECRFVGFGAARGEKDRLHVATGHLDKAFRERNRRDVRRSDVAGKVGQLFHLRGGGVRQFGAAVPRIDVPQAGQTVEILASVNVLNRSAASADADDSLLVVGWVVQRVN